MTTDNHTLDLGFRRIGAGQPCLIIAEAGVNHNGDVGLARELIRAARRAGADAVKFQTWITEKLVTRTAPSAAYQQRNCDAVDQFDMLKRLELSQAQFRDLKACAEAEGILFLSTPDEEESAAFLVSLGVPLLKIGSGEVTNLPYLDFLARQRLPLILSTGMATLGEVECAVDTIRYAGAPGLALLHCVTDYPAQPADCNLRAMATLRQAFACPVGYSDHTLGCELACAAVALGACIIEKHFTLDCSLPGPDHRASITPTALAALVSGVRKVEAALGDGVKRPAAVENANRSIVRKSIVVARDLPVGHVLTRDDLVLRRSPAGLPPSALAVVCGRTLRVPLEALAPVAWEALA